MRISTLATLPFTALVFSVISLTMSWNASNYTHESGGLLHIKRVTGFLASLEYTFDEYTGNEELITLADNLIGPDAYLSVKYEGVCKCITSIYQTWTSGREVFTALATDTIVLADSSWDPSNPETLRPVDYSEVKDFFESAQIALENARSTYGHI